MERAQNPDSSRPRARVRRRSDVTSVLAERLRAQEAVQSAQDLQDLSERLSPVIEMRSIRSLMPNPRNARKHSKKQVRQIGASISQFGFNVPVVVNDDDLTLRSRDPWAQPNINFKYFGDYKDGPLPDDGDLEAMAEAIEFVNGMNEELGDKIAASVVPGEPNVQYDLATEEGRKRFVVDEAWGHHASCTCAIGKVLDSKFNVRDTKNLRVVDASVFPKIPGLFIVVPVYMISEKASDVIIQDAKDKALI